MKRKIIYPGAVPVETDVLAPQVNTMRAIGAALASILGTAQLADGFACTPGSGLNVSVGPGTLTALAAVDTASFSSIAAASDLIVKQACNIASTTLGPFTAPAGAGQSVNILVQGLFVESDDVPALLPYMNATNPSVPFGGPGNNGVSQPTARNQWVSLSYNVGTPAATGSQTTPAPDAGNVPLWIVVIAHGATSIAGGNICVHPAAPFIGAKLTARAPLDSPVFINTPNAPTPPYSDNSTRLATTAWVRNNRSVFIPTYYPAGTYYWIVPAGVTQAKFTLVAGGGGGAGGNSTHGGGGGGGGEVIEKTLTTLAPGGVVTIVVGAGGAGGAPGAAGGSGGGTSVTYGGVTYAANGGGGGGFTPFPAGGSGGYGGNGDLSLPGGFGSDSGTGTTGGGNGAAGYMGQGAGRAATGTGQQGMSYGAGGGGSYGGGAASGGNGGQGLAKVEC